MSVKTLMTSILLAMMVFLGAISANAAEPAGAVYTLSNQPDGNSVLVFNRAVDGTLTSAGTFPTGGRGTGTSLGNQSAVVLDQSQRWLFAINAGSDEVTVFAIRPTGLTHVHTVHSGGFRPISLTVFGNLLYVLNAGGNVGDSDNITGFLIAADGRLFPLPHSTRRLSSDVTDPAQIAFTPDGTALLVTEKATNRLDTYRVVDWAWPVVRMSRMPRVLPLSASRSGNAVKCLCQKPSLGCPTEAHCHPLRSIVGAASR